MPTEALVLAIDRVPDNTVKRCETCGRTKRLDEFARNRSKPNGLQSCCLQCMRLRAYTRYHEGGGKEARAEYLARPDVRERNRRYREGLKGEKRRASNRAYLATARGRLVAGRCNARCELRRTTDPGRRAAIEARIALFDREIARLDRRAET